MADKNKIIYLWEDPPFRAIFDQDLNPGIDPKTIKCRDATIQIKYRTQNGEECTITPYYLTRRKGFSHSPKKSISEHKYCIDDPLFMEWYNPFADLNSDVDVGVLRTNDRCTLLSYIENGEQFQITPRQIINYLHANISLRKTRESRSRISFKEWFEKYADLNPGIDPDKVSLNDNKTILYYRPKDCLEICTITPNDLSRIIGCRASGERRKTVLAKSIPGFIEWFDLYKDLNPGIDISVLNAYSEVLLYYQSGDGTVGSISARSLCRRKYIFSRPPKLCLEIQGFAEWFEMYRWLNPTIDIAKLTLSKTVKLRYLYNGKIKEITPYGLCSRKRIMYQIRQTIQDDPLFWSYCIEKDRKVVNSFSKTNTRTYFKMRCPEGHEYTQNAKMYYQYCNIGRDPCPYCDGRKTTPGVNDIVTIDPDMKFFYSDENVKPAYMVSLYNTHKRFKFNCPYCGYKFTKRMENIVGKTPKCPHCKDQGANIPTDQDYMPSGIPFFTIRDDLKSRRGKKK